MNNSSTDSERTVSEQRGRRELPRRTIVKGAAWSLPVIVAAVAVPAQAASGCASGNYTAAVPNPSLRDRATETFTVPAGVTSVTFVVTGGSGALGGLNGAAGGAGRQVTAIVPVVPGEQLTLITGQGGINADTRTIGNPDRFTLRQGGGGYGGGGNTQVLNTNYGTDPSTQYAQSGGSGGGGSAILRGTTPLIVAGGGGGGGMAAVPQPEGANWPSTSGAPGAGGDTGGLVSTRSRTNPPVTVQTTAGSAGTTSAPGAGGAAGTITGAALLDSKAGSTGAVHLANGTAGGGADGVPENYPNLVPTTTDVGAVSAGGTSGAGGGGYTGGGSGSVVAGGSTTRGRILATAGGGGGASYIGPSVTLVSSVVANRPGVAYNTRVPGQITLTWTC